MKYVALALVLAASIARADAPSTIKVPAGWKADDELTRELAGKVAGLTVFGIGDSHVANAVVYLPPERGVSLVVVQLAASITAQRPAAVRAAIDDMHATTNRAATTGDGIVEEGWQEKVDPAGRQVEATLAWKNTITSTHSTARRIVVGDAGTLVSVTAECFAMNDADPKLVADCTAALATLDPGIDRAQRVELQLAPAGTRPVLPDVVTTVTGSGSSAAPSMTSGPRASLPPMTMPAQDVRTVDRRPVYVGIGLVVLAAVFWWNRRRRARLEGKANE